MLIHKNIQGYREPEAVINIKTVPPPIHVNEESAYVVHDYPYGAYLRCDLRVWIEYDKKRGYRFCRSTIDPRNGRKNKPKKDTYIPLALILYVGTDDRLYTLGLSSCSDKSEILDFIDKYGAFLPSGRVEFLKRCLGMASESEANAA